MSQMSLQTIFSQWEIRTTTLESSSDLFTAMCNTDKRNCVWIFVSAPQYGGADGYIRWSDSGTAIQIVHGHRPNGLLSVITETLKDSVFRVDLQFKPFQCRSFCSCAFTFRHCYVMSIKGWIKKWPVRGSHAMTQSRRVVPVRSTLYQS